jgi:hypothetical protein
LELTQARTASGFDSDQAKIVLEEMKWIETSRDEALLQARVNAQCMQRNAQQAQQQQQQIFVQQQQQQRRQNEQNPMMQMMNLLMGLRTQPNAIDFQSN